MQFSEKPRRQTISFWLDEGRIDDFEIFPAADATAVEFYTAKCYRLERPASHRLAIGARKCHGAAQKRLGRVDLFLYPFLLRKLNNIHDLATRNSTRIAGMALLFIPSPLMRIGRHPLIIQVLQAWGNVP